MNRIKDYIGFAAWFAGLGYIVLWPVTSPELGGKPFGASVFCRDGSPGMLDFLCNAAQSAAHAAGFARARFHVGGVRDVAAAVLRDQAVAPCQRAQDAASTTAAMSTAAK